MSVSSTAARADPVRAAALTRLQPAAAVVGPVNITPGSRPQGQEIAPNAVSGAAAPIATPAAPAVDSVPRVSPPTQVSVPRRPVVPTITPGPGAGLGIRAMPPEAFIVMSQAAKAHVRQIYVQGQAQGRDAQAYSIVGDSTMIWPPFLAAFASPQAYTLGPYADLQPTLQRFAHSFARESAAVHKGMHTWTEFDATWADAARCQAGEGPLACELRLHNPSVAIIRLGVNDANEPEAFEFSMRRIVDTCLAVGVIPVLGTKPDRLEGPENTINQLIYRLAADYSIPLWDYDLVAGTVPGKGLMADGIHFLAGGPHDYTSPATFQNADSLEDLTGLMMLDAIRREVAGTK